MNLRNVTSNIQQRAILVTLIIAFLCLQPAAINLPAAFAQYGITASSDYPIKVAYPFKLAVNQTAYLAPAELVFRFVNVTEDSRCPSDVQCIWAGQVSILIDYAATSTGENLGNFSLTLSGGFYNVQDIEGYTIRLAKVEPYPVSTQPKHLSEYVATLVVLNADSNISESVMASSPVALDAFDERLEKLEVGGQVKVSSSIHNGSDEEKYFVSILEARSQDGVTQFLGWNIVTIQENAWLDVGLWWTPEQAGNYELRTFLIGTFEEPQVLSPVMTSSIEVQAANTNSVAGILTISTDKSAYQLGETVTFTIRNNGLSALAFPDPGLGLAIMNVDTGKFVYTGRLAPQVIHYIQPLQSETNEWEGTELTRNEMGQIEYRAVEPGKYSASVRTAGGFEPKAMAEVSFVIG